jgi:hypothetical protein
MYKPLHLVFAVVIAAVPSAALAQNQSRCQSDSLDPTQAAARLEWARKCGLLNNTGGPSSAFDSDTWSDPSGNAVKEYREIDPAKSFSGNVDDYLVNYQFAHYMYLASPYFLAVKETSGPTNGYWKWSAYKKVGGVPTPQTVRPRPLYPTFGPQDDTDTAWYPHPSLLTLPTPPWQTVDCKLYTDDHGTTQATGAFWVAGYCESSCYTPDQSLRFSNGDVNIVEALGTKRTDLVTLSPDATLDDLTTQVSQVLNYTLELRDAKNPIVKLTTASGGSLTVTTEHPVITSKGQLVKAESLVEGDALLLANGTPDPITHIEKGSHFGKVYNIKPVSPEPVANILIAQGFLVGSARFQNDDVGYINRILLFRKVPIDVMPK